MTETEQIPLINNEESLFINENARGKLYVKTLLWTARKDSVSLSEALEIVLKEPDQEEHQGAYQRATKFLEEHADRFKISLKPDKTKI